MDFFLDISQAVGRTLSGKAKALKDYLEDLSEQVDENS